MTADLIFQFPDREEVMIVDCEDEISGFDTLLISWTARGQGRYQNSIAVHVRVALTEHTDR
jgi:hypothetical protein